MQAALDEAKKAFERKEVPVGAVLVYRGNVIAKAHNLVESKKDATAHAEMLCLQKGAAIFGNWRLLEMTLYSSLEPCSMCAGAMLLSRIQRLVYGAEDFRHGAHVSFSDLLQKKHPTHSIEIKGGVLEEASQFLLKEFFKQRRLDATA